MNQTYLLIAGGIFVCIIALYFYFRKPNATEAVEKATETKKEEETFVATADPVTDEVKGVQYVRMPDYEVHEIPNFLTSEECDRIIALSKDKLSDSKVYSDQEDLYQSNSRQSKQCWLEDDDNLVKSISDRVKTITNTQNRHQEHLQVVNYQAGGFFSPHYDACEGTTTYCSRMNGSQGPRYLTFLIYLNDEFEGGETVFPKIKKEVKPKKGKAVIFQSVDQDGVIIKEALHGGKPVKNGEKWIANKWIRLYE
jgi:hypothetical protein